MTHPDIPLGREVAYPGQYDPTLLFPIPRAQAQTTATPAAASAPRRSPFRGQRESARAQQFYASRWGVDKLVVSYTNSGNLIRFSYRVLDPARAAPLNDHALEPALLDAQAGVRLVVPSVDNVGALRQSATPVAGHAYWMAFSNKGRLVKRGDHVDIVVGGFRASGLVID